MQIGILPSLGTHLGGIHQYSLTILSALRKLSASNEDNTFVILTRPETAPYLDSFRSPHWQVIELPGASSMLSSASTGSWLSKINFDKLKLTILWPYSLFRQALLLKTERIKRRPEFTSFLKSQGIDWVFYTAPDHLSFEIGLPYVMPIHDLQHRLQPEFPEVSARGEWILREYLFRNASRYATLLLADSETGKEDILACYAAWGITAERVKVLPYLPAVYLPAEVSPAERERVRQVYQLPERYLFYPAQFWPHKNHARIIQAIGQLKRDKNLIVPLVFCGSHTTPLRERTFRQTQNLAQELGIQAQTRWLGYIPDEDMAGMYAGAQGLIMPTFFGPTNIPVLEAWAYHCPVITSDIHGIRQQTGEAAILVDPRSVDAIARGIHRLWTDEALRKNLIENGRMQLNKYTPKDFENRLKAIVEEASQRVRNRDHPSLPK